MVRKNVQENIVRVRNKLYFCKNSMKMTQVNNRTYQLLKENKVVLETDAATFDRAFDYFCEIHPSAYTDKTYSFRTAKKSYEV